VSTVSPRGWDLRVSLAGGAIMSRGHHLHHLEAARHFVWAAAVHRRVGHNRAAAARCLKRAGWHRRRFYEATTPAPAPPGSDWVWMPTLHSWMPRDPQQVAA
jgi:hypothetical protein